MTDGCVCCEREGDTDAESERETDAVRPAERERDMVLEDVLVGETVVAIALGVCGCCVSSVEAVGKGVLCGESPGVARAELLGVPGSIGVTALEGCVCVADVKAPCVSRGVPEGVVVAEQLGVFEAVGVAEIGVCETELAPEVVAVS